MEVVRKLKDANDLLRIAREVIRAGIGESTLTREIDWHLEECGHEKHLLDCSSHLYNTDHRNSQP